MRPIGTDAGQCPVRDEIRLTPAGRPCRVHRSDQAAFVTPDAGRTPIDVLFGGLVATGGTNGRQRPHHKCRMPAPATDA